MQDNLRQLRNGKDSETQKEMREVERKRDCETKAFKRLAKKPKKVFPRLPTILLADSLCVSEPVLDICWGNHPV